MFLKFHTSWVKNGTFGNLLSVVLYDRVTIHTVKKLLTMIYIYTVAREPADERLKRCGLVGSKAGYGVKRGCYLLSFGLERLLPSCS